MSNQLSKKRIKFNKKSLGSALRKYYSSVSYSQFKITLPIIKKHLKGKLIDVGCGDLYYKQFITEKVDIYDSIDYLPKTEGVTFKGDIQDMHMIKNAQYDSAICLEVLEHVPNPQKALKEISRILKKNGLLVVSVPHLSRLHEMPFDFYRYTKFGLKHLFENAGFELISIKERGGVFSFLAHQISSVLVTATINIPIIAQMVYFLNALLIALPAYYTDLLFKTTKRLPAGYTILAKKR